jgi:hypothetical protein
MQSKLNHDFVLFLIVVICENSLTVCFPAEGPTAILHLLRCKVVVKTVHSKQKRLNLTLRDTFEKAETRVYMFFYTPKMTKQSKIAKGKAYEPVNLTRTNLGTLKTTAAADKKVIPW